jgi:hypothetical protein
MAFWAISSGIHTSSAQETWDGQGEEKFTNKTDRLFSGQDDRCPVPCYGPVVFSMRTGAPLIPLFTVRDAPDHHRLIITPPFAIADTGDRDQDILVTTAGLTKLIESYIRQYPAQGWWFHRRWKKARRRTEEPLLAAAACSMQPSAH